jgi:hypothetical protein
MVRTSLPPIGWTVCECEKSTNGEQAYHLLVEKAVGSVEEGPSLGLYREEGRENNRPIYLQERSKSIAFCLFFSSYSVKLNHTKFGFIIIQHNPYFLVLMIIRNYLNRQQTVKPIMTMIIKIMCFLSQFVSVKTLDSFTVQKENKYKEFSCKVIGYMRKLRLSSYMTYHLCISLLG